MKLNGIYIAICTVKLVKVINSIWSSYYQFYTVITCTDTHNLLRGVLKRKYLTVYEGLKQMLTSYPIWNVNISFSLCLLVLPLILMVGWNHYTSCDYAVPLRVWGAFGPPSWRWSPTVTESDSRSVVPLDLCWRDFQAAQDSLNSTFS